MTHVIRLLLKLWLALLEPGTDRSIRRDRALSVKSINCTQVHKIKGNWRGGGRRGLGEGGGTWGWAGYRFHVFHLFTFFSFFFFFTHQIRMASGNAREEYISIQLYRTFATTLNIQAQVHKRK